MAEGGATYKSYLLRLWRGDSASAPWRASLKSVTGGGAPRNFPDLESLVAFLLEELENGPAPSAVGNARDE